MLPPVNDLLPRLFPALALATAIWVPLYAWAVRGRTYAVFSGVVLAIALPGALIGHARLVALLPSSLTVWLDAAFAYSMLAAAIHLSHLVRARMRSPLFRIGVSVPGQTFVAAGALSGVWLLLMLPVRGLLMALSADSLLDALRWLDFVPFVVAVFSILTSSRPRPEWVRVRLGEDGPDVVTRVPLERSRKPHAKAADGTALRIVQITDPHLGPWQSVRSLRRQIEKLASTNPDLVLLTGDFLTMESNGTPGALADAFSPLRPMADRCFAAFGNHDHEAPDEVRSGLAANGIRLLVDEEVLVDTPVGVVQIVGADWVRKDRRQHIRELLARLPRRPDAVRLFLLHDPLGFRDVPPGDVDLTLSGHTHGGQVGLVSLGFDWTVLTRSRWPDHGLFALGASRLYVHRGTGFYGFPLRVGVPGEASVLELVV